MTTRPVNPLTVPVALLVKLLFIVSVPVPLIDPLMFSGPVTVGAAPRSKLQLLLIVFADTVWLNTTALKALLLQASAPPPVLSKMNVPLLWLNVPPVIERVTPRFVVVDGALNVPALMLRVLSMSSA